MGTTIINITYKCMEIIQWTVIQLISSNPVILFFQAKIKLKTLESELSIPTILPSCFRPNTNYGSPKNYLFFALKMFSYAVAHISSTALSSI